MKKIIFILAIFLLEWNSAFAQNIYYDALKLKKNLFVGKTTFKDKDGKTYIALADADSIFLILKNYTKVNTLSKEYIANAFNLNPFIRFPKNNFVQNTPDGAEINNIVNSIGGVDVTNIANGLADLLIERGKQELTVAFFDRFQTFSKSHPEFQILFPKTTSNLNNLLTYAYPQMIQALRSGFMDDLKQIPYNLDDVLELPKYKDLLSNFPEITVAIRSLKLIHELGSGTSNAADIISEFAAFPEWQRTGSNTFNNMANTIKLAAIFSDGLRSTDTTKVWITGTDMKKIAVNVASNDTLTKIFMGLLYQTVNNKGIKFNLKKDTTSTPLTTIITAQRDNLILFQSKLAKFLSLADKVTVDYKYIKSINDTHKKLSDSDVYNYINVSLDVVDYSFSIVKIFDTSLTSGKYMAIAHKANDIYKDVYSKQYTAVVNDAVDFLQGVYDLTKTNNTKFDSVTKAKVTAGLDTLLDFVQKVKPYALLMANIVEAKTSDDVKTALENAILPVGSYSVKQKSLSNISINGYIGYAFDFNKVGFSNVYARGFYAPIGFSWTFNLEHLFSPKSSITRPCFLTPTIFASVLDVGSIVSYKLSNTTTTAGSSTTLNQQIKIGSIFSPSAQLLLGIRGLPIAVGAGWRRTPTLFYSGNSTYATVGARDVFNVTALIDIPFFTLHNKPFNQ